MTAQFIEEAGAARFSTGLLAYSTRLGLLPVLSTPSRPSSGPNLNASPPGALSRNPRLVSVAARRGALVDVEHLRHLTHPVLLVNLLEEAQKP